ncbi:hypothetical protein M9H77_29989 [Catharanthus roseus]|uniref:Uncharacterized protein n=1 Tax=Catharanthus roseus TaxID=4058 RepID=A0ACB9ZYJ8_CATRO|nr:hypothetical protein M9H77_29989 [Catharanthus roseus]
MDEGRSLTYSNPLAQAIDKSPSQEIVTVSIKKNLGAMKGSTTFIITPKLVEPVPLSGEKIPILIDVPSALQPKGALLKLKHRSPDDHLRITTTVSTLQKS